MTGIEYLMLLVTAGGAIFAGGSLWVAFRAEGRACRAEAKAETLERLQISTLKHKVVQSMKEELKSFYGTGEFLQKAKKLIDEGGDVMAVLKATEWVLAEKEESTSKRSRRFIEFRAEILDYADSRSVTAS